ncbi:MAG TPA: hypothetical protein VG605_21615 [Puia sp.]|jgi:hypothetical protein|nr:hypothetical protein [Puia sp.]
MKTQAIFYGAPRQTQLQPYQPSANRIKVSLHQLVDDLVTSLQPLAMKRNNVIVNGVPAGLSFIAEENVLAYVLWNMLTSVINEKKNECIHIQTLVDDDRTMICIKDAGNYIYRALASDYRKLQEAAAQVGGCINLYNDDQYGSNIVFSISNTRMAM